MKRLSIVILLVVAAGCVKQTLPSGETVMRLDPNSPVVGAAESAAEAGSALLPLLGPGGALAGGILAGALAQWRRMKPALSQSRTEAEHYHAATAATVEAIEAFKSERPEEWAQLKTLLEAQIARQGLDPKSVENVIRALRGLPAKS